MGVLGSALLAGMMAMLAPTGAPVPLSVVEGHLLLVPVRVNGAGPFPFLLDTGSSATILDPGVAGRIGLRAHERVAVVGLGGTVDVPRARLERLTVGPKSVEGLDVLLSDLGGIRRLDSRIVGLLGQDVLGRFDYLVSYGRRHLRFDAEAAGAGVRVPFERYRGRMVVEVALGDEGDARRFVLDSGASTVVLFDRRLRAGSVQREVGRVEVHTHRGPRALRPGRIDRLTIAGRERTGLPAVLLDDPQRLAASSEDGLLPTHLFASVFFDNRDRSVVLTHGTDKWRAIVTR